MKISWIPFLIVIVLGNLIVQPIIWSQPSEDIIVEKSCYDRYGQICEDKTFGMSTNWKIVFSLLMLVLSLIFTTLLSPGAVNEELRRNLNQRGQA